MAAKSLSDSKKAPQPSPAVAALDRPEVVPVEPLRLSLDPENPRLAGVHFEISDQHGIAEWLWKNKAVDEIVDSILSSGFWTHEELFATEEQGRLVVIEGNRRLAAIKVLTEERLQARLKVRYDVSPDVARTFAVLPVIISTREDVWRYIGFKHVNGPQEWDSIAKAQYVFNVKERFDVPLDEIAQSIGDRHDTVARLYRGYLVLKQAQDTFGFDPTDAYNRKFPFSHLWTALGYSSVQQYLGVSAERLQKKDPVPAAKIPRLKSFMTWVFGSRQTDTEPVVKRQNPDLRNLATALETDKGVQVLEAGLSLSVAVEASRGDGALFRDALVQAEANLRDAKRFVATGYSGEAHLLDTAAQVSTLAVSLRKEMMDVQRNGLPSEE